MSRAAVATADVDRRSAIAGVTILGVVGSIVFLLLPLLVGAFTETLSLGTRQVGYLGSADMVGMFLAAVLATLWVRRWDWRRAGAAAAGLLAVSHLVSAFLAGLVPLLVVRVVAGFAGGSLMSIALTSLGDTRGPDRWFAVFISGQLGLGALALWRMPQLIAAWGLRGVFLVLALLTVAAALCLPLIPRRGRPRVPDAGDGEAPRSIVPGAMALAGCLAFNTGIMAVWAYMERIGDAAGLAASAIGDVLGVALLGGLFGALIAAALGDRLGRVVPLVTAVALQFLALWLIAGRPSTAAFGAGVLLFSFCWNFPVAYQLAVTVSVDSSNRLVVLFLSAVKLGYAIGPALAAQLIASSDGFGVVIVLGGACFLLSGAVFLPLAWMAGRRREA
ncbi:MAG: MFS transporter [Thermoanaerobaculia bacterium]